MRSLCRSWTIRLEEPIDPASEFGKLLSGEIKHLIAKVRRLLPCPWFGAPPIKPAQDLIEIALGENLGE
jgi:hypothetical protein